MAGRLNSTQDATIFQKHYRILIGGFHVEVGAPRGLFLLHELPDVVNPVRFSRTPQKSDVSLVRSPIPFLPIADMAAADEIIPGVFSSPLLRDHMINGHGNASTAAILTPVLITLQDVLSRKNDVIPSYPDVFLKFYDTGQRKSHARRMDEVPVILDHLHLVQINKTDGPFGRTDEMRLVILVKDQNLPVQYSVTISLQIPQRQHLSILFANTIRLSKRSLLRREFMSKVPILTKPEQCMNSSFPTEMAT